MLGLALFFVCSVGVNLCVLTLWDWCRGETVGFAGMRWHPSGRRVFPPRRS